jgi:hypothetical protein
MNFGAVYRVVEYCDIDITAEGQAVTLEGIAGERIFSVCTRRRAKRQELILDLLPGESDDYCVYIDIPPSVGLKPATPLATAGYALAAGWTELEVGWSSLGELAAAVAGQFPLALLLTLVIEVGVLASIMHVGHDMDMKRIVVVGAIASCLTLPLLWYVLPLIVPRPNYPLVAEGVAVALESILYYYALRISAGRAVALSLITNVLSFIVGLAVF